MAANDRETSVDPLWYKDAIIYELHVKTFCDSDGDGMGRFSWPDRKAGLFPGTRHYRHLAPAVLSVAAS